MVNNQTFEYFCQCFHLYKLYGSGIFIQICLRSSHHIVHGHINNNRYISINNMWFCISARSSFDLHIRPATAQLTCFSKCLLTLEPSYCSCYKENCISLSSKRARSVYKNALVLVRLLSCTRQRSVHSIFTLTWYKTACMRYPLHPPTPPKLTDFSVELRNEYDHTGTTEWVSHKSLIRTSWSHNKIRYI